MPSAPTAENARNRNEILHDALLLAKLGWRVAPAHRPVDLGICSCGRENCNTIGKHPRTMSWIERATIDEGQIREWFDGEYRGNSNLLVLTGAGSGIVVLDVDPRHGGDDTLRELEAEHGRLPHTVEAVTGGGGRHLIFAHPGGVVRNRVGIAPGFDVRGDGGGVIAPPSLHPSGTFYRWEASGHPSEVALASQPKWLRDLTDPPQLLSVYEPLDVHAVVNNGVPEGQRDDTIFRLACRLRRDDVPRDEAERMVLRAAANCSPPFPANQALQKVESAYSRYEPATGSQFQLDQDIPSTGPKREAREPQFITYTTSELLGDYNPPKPLIWPYAFPGHMTLIGSWMGVGKTTVSNAVIAALLTGERAFGLLDVGVLEGHIVLFTELAGNPLRRTLRELVDTYELDQDHVAAMLHVRGFSGQSMLTEDAKQAFREQCIGAGEVILDTFDEWLGVNPNETVNALAGWATLREVAAEEGAAILVFDHQGKNVDTYSKEQSAVAGASSKQRLPDLVLRLDRVSDPKPHNQLRVVKDRFGDAFGLDLFMNDDGRLTAEVAPEDRGMSRKVGEASRFIVAFLESRGKSRRGQIVEAAKQAQHTRSTVNRALDALLAEGAVVRPEHGTFELAPVSNPPPRLPKPRQ